MDRIDCADCFDYLDSLPAASVDMVLTDPPYGTTHANWDIRVDESRLFESLWRVAKPAAPIIMFSQNPIAAELIVQQKHTFRYEWVWEKPLAVGFLNAEKMPLRCHELALVFYRQLPTFHSIPLACQRGVSYVHKERKSGGLVYNKISKCGASSSLDGERCPRDVVKYARDVMPLPHGTPKPFALISMLIQQYTNFGDTVLDPFVGSGTTPAAAKACGRHWLGCEKNEDFAAFARRRIDDTAPPLGDFGTEGLYL